MAFHFPFYSKIEIWPVFELLIEYIILKYTISIDVLKDLGEKCGAAIAAGEKLAAIKNHFSTM
ncbi:hypothetical protein [Faecalispora sporosphaeroides]|uniref:hypothetical protein n=1 Tax=Faecalispora sporosphaeroides TaxID=1549 RepID=UPI00036092B6|nr:hypothetical protein [Faecalispora sporosphaeroides]